MSAIIPWAVLLGLAAVVARYLRHESSTHRKLVDQQQATLGEVLEELTSLRSALLAAGTIERSARLPPPSPVPSGSSPRALPVRVVPVTRDDDVVHTRDTKVQPAADALVDATRPAAKEGELPLEATQPSTQSPGPAEPYEGLLIASMQADLDRLEANPASTSPSEIKGSLDTLDALLRQHPGHRGLLNVRARWERLSKQPIPKANADEDARTTGDDMTKVIERSKLSTKRPPPHRPSQKVDPLANVPMEKSTSSASRTAPLGRHPTREPSWIEKRSAQLIEQGIDPAVARKQAEEEGSIARAARGAARPPTPTPTEPGAENIDARIERRWAEKVAAAQAAGKNANHCHGQACLEQGRDISACECHCDGCRLVVALHVQAAREIRAEDDWGKP